MVSSSNPPPCRWPAGGFWHDLSLVLAPVLPFISTMARLAIVLFLWIVCVRAFPAPPPPNRRHATGARTFAAPPRPTGGTCEVLDGWLSPCCKVYVSFTRPLGVWELILSSPFFDSWSIRRAGVSPNLPYFCICGSSGWVGVGIYPRKACKYPD